MAKAKVASPISTPAMRPALIPENREQQLAALAMDLVEQRLRDGTASSQETTHFLKAVSSESVLKKKLMEKDIELAEAKTKALADQAELKELYADALKAMRNYAGQGDPDEY